MKTIHVCESSQPPSPARHVDSRAQKRPRQDPSSGSTSAMAPAEAAGGNSKDEEHHIRFMLTEQEDTLQPVSVCTMWRRSELCSHFSRHYDGSSETKDEDGGAENSTGGQDPYSKAVAQLHISVLPAALPCREEEQHRVFQFLKSAMSDEGRKRPLYISGMPGTVTDAPVTLSIDFVHPIAEPSWL